jgi:hypothetical protein
MIYDRTKSVEGDDKSEESETKIVPKNNCIKLELEGELNGR